MRRPPQLPVRPALAAILLLLGLSGLAEAAPQAGAAGDPPNILFLFADDQSYYTVGAYGDPIAASPTLDQLAASGVLMTRGYANALFCKPSRNSLFASWYPHQHGWLTNSVEVPGGEQPTVLFPEILAGAGYYTKGIGKWHSTFTPAAAGFQSYQDATDVAGAARDFLSTRAGDSQPWLLYLSFNETHGPWTEGLLPRGWAADPRGGGFPFRPNVNVPRARGPLAQDLFQEEGFRKLRRQDLNPYDPARVIAAYYREANHLDGQVRRVLARLESLGMTDNTLILFTADQGAMAGNHFLWYKGPALYEELIHVPMIVSWPGVIPPGSTSQAYFSTVDIGPTLLDAAGLASPPEFRGQSLKPALLGQDHAGADHLICQLAMDAPGSGQIRSIRTRAGHLFPEEWKLVLNERDLDELYDLSHDPFELDNKILQPAFLAQFLRLRGELLEWMTDHSDPAYSTFR